MVCCGEEYIQSLSGQGGHSNNVFFGSTILIKWLRRNERTMSTSCFVNTSSSTLLAILEFLASVRSVARGSYWMGTAEG